MSSNAELPLYICVLKKRKKKEKKKISFDIFRLSTLHSAFPTFQFILYLCHPLLQNSISRLQNIQITHKE
jgi:hypothetical protein